MPVAANPLSEGAARGLAPRHVEIVRPPGVATYPTRVGVDAWPAGGGDRERVQGGAQALDGAVEAIEGPHRAQHVGEVGSLAPSLDQKPTLPAQIEGGVEEQRLGAARDEPGPEPAQHRGVKARVGELEPEQVPPVDPRPRGVRSATVRKILRESEQRDEREPPRALGRPPALGEQDLELPIVEDRAESVAQVEVAAPLRKGGAGHHGGRGRHLAAGVGRSDMTDLPGDSA